MAKIAQMEEEKEELQSYDEESLDEDDRKRLEELEDALIDLSCLNPSEDVDCFCNYSNTSVYFTNNGNLYRKYLEEEIASIEDNMGFSFGG